MSNQTSQKSSEDKPFDLFIIGGGVNGCGIARDAAGRGLSVGLAEMNDLASATSSASTKLFHGGLRYLEYFEFRLVRESLIERENLLAAMPHISWPLRFVLPYHGAMRFELKTPLSRLLAIVCPWMKGQRPAWLIRLGLFLYDHLGGRKILPGTKVIDLAQDESGDPLQDQYQMAFEYSDCWVEDSRLVVLNARDARNRGAVIMPRTKVVCCKFSNGFWQIETINTQTGKPAINQAKCLINAGGPWVEEIIKNIACSRINTNSSPAAQKPSPTSKDCLRLVRGSHIITRQLYAHEKAYFFQGEDGRIIFTIPYEGEFTLIGTTDVDHPSPSIKPVCSDEEEEYLLAFASRYFKQKLTKSDVHATYSGVRPLYNNGSARPAAATRDYVLRLDSDNNAPLLNIFGGKITTYRKLAESALDAVKPFFPALPGKWTVRVPLPGGDFAVDGFDLLVGSIKEQYPFVPASLAQRLVRAYGTDTWDILGSASEIGDLGADFNASIYQCELDWAIDNEWVCCAEDFVWRRTRLALRLSEAEIAAIDEYIRQRMAGKGTLAC